MKWSSGLSFLTAFRARRGSGNAEADHADMGTAFGLDASFGAAEPVSEPARQPGDESTDVPRWQARLIRRSGL